MSATIDQLSRAANVLRESVMGTSRSPWQASGRLVTSITGEVVAETPDSTGPATITRGGGGPPDAAYMARMHPTVALNLANAFQEAAYEAGRRDAVQAPHTVLIGALVALARTVLHE